MCVYVFVYVYINKHTHTYIYIYIYIPADPMVSPSATSFLFCACWSLFPLALSIV